MLPNGFFSTLLFSFYLGNSWAVHMYLHMIVVTSHNNVAQCMYVHWPLHVVTVVQVQFLNTTLTFMEGETAELAIFSTATAPFNISLSATLEAGSSQQQSMNYLYLLQRTVVIHAGSSNTSLPLYIVPSMGNGTETVVEVVLELVDGTETSVELGPNARVAVTIVRMDIICFVPTGKEKHLQ
jgi:hypothetical protein